MSGSKAEALLLVDGYNIIGAWPSLINMRDRHGLEPARQKLIEKLINFSTHQGYKTQVIFDSQYQKSPVSSEVFSRNFSIYFTAFAQTADSYIERLCATLGRQVSSSRLIVATSDEAQRRTVIGYGAECISAKRLLSEVNSADDKIRRNNCSNGSHRGSRYLSNGLSPDAREILDRWIGRIE
jgi:hypothetical protein